MTFTPPLNAHGFPRHSQSWSGHRALLGLARRISRISALRRLAVRRLEARMRARAASPSASLRQPPTVAADKLAVGIAVLHTVERVLADGSLSDASFEGLVRLLVRDVLVRHGEQTAKAAFKGRHACGPPDFLTLSPGKACNLKCPDCYASSGPNREKLDWRTLDRIVGDAHDQWGTRFFVLSGGEPLAYRDRGHGVLELVARHRDCYFVMYTNGTLIDDAVADRLGELGNLSPALSVEGMKERTDARRGPGVFDRVLGAMKRLRRAGVVFGVSLTATRENADEVLSDEVVDLFFGEMSARYAFVFHYMPIGRGCTLGLMTTPPQRVRLWERHWQLVRERKLFIADFWNSATATNGCVAGGRPGGYLYVDWNGAVSPCVFVPYSPVNIRDVYARGGSLDDVWTQPFFGAIRGWQRSYGYRENGEAPGPWGNWMIPCLIRDHHGDFRRLVSEHRPEPTDDSARVALADPGYESGLLEFDRSLAALCDPIWQSRYLRMTGSSCPPAPPLEDETRGSPRGATEDDA